MKQKKKPGENPQERRNLHLSSHYFAHVPLVTNLSTRLLET